MTQTKLEKDILHQLIEIVDKGFFVTLLTEGFSSYHSVLTGQQDCYLALVVKELPITPDYINLSLLRKDYVTFYTNSVTSVDHPIKTWKLKNAILKKMHDWLVVDRFSFRKRC